MTTTTLEFTRQLERSRSEGVREAARLTEQLRQRKLREIDRQLSSGPWAGLYRTGQAAQAVADVERRQHKLTVERGAGPDSVKRWGRTGGYHVACSCGWTSKPAYTREHAAQILRDERDHMFRMLSSSVEHSEP